MLQEPPPTPSATESVVYGIITANGQQVVTSTVFQLTTGDMLTGVLLLIIAMILLTILITMQWNHKHA